MEARGRQLVSYMMHLPAQQLTKRKGDENNNGGGRSRKITVKEEEGAKKAGRPKKKTKNQKKRAKKAKSTPLQQTAPENSSDSSADDLAVDRTVENTPMVGEANDKMSKVSALDEPPSDDITGRNEADNNDARLQDPFTKAQSKQASKTSKAKSGIHMVQAETNTRTLRSQAKAKAHQEPDPREVERNAHGKASAGNKHRKKISVDRQSKVMNASAHEAAQVGNEANEAVPAATEKRVRIQEPEGDEGLEETDEEVGQPGRFAASDADQMMAAIKGLLEHSFVVANTFQRWAPEDMRKNVGETFEDVVKKRKSFGMEEPATKKRKH